MLINLAENPSPNTKTNVFFSFKQPDEELELPILAGFEWDKEESWTRLIVHQKKEGQSSSSGGGSKKKKGKGGDDDD